MSVRGDSASAMVDMDGSQVVGPAATPVRLLRDTCAIQERSEWAPYGAGGAWRRRQVDGILRRHGFEPTDLEPMTSASLPRKLLMAARAKRSCGRAISWRRTSLAAASYSYGFYRQNASRPGVVPIVLLEWGTDPVAFRALKDAGSRIVVVLMAVGALWRERTNPISGSFPAMFIAEIDNLRHADAIFSISREEQWLLRNLGIDARYLPYFPDEEREAALLAERRARPESIGGTPAEFLICATRGNSDSVESFREQAAWIRDIVPEGAARFHVTGNQTEQVRDIWADPRFVFHGTCPDDVFVDLKRRCRAICLHSIKGIGAVTRIPDMLLAGLAVIANAAAARSFLGLEGVHVYDTCGQFRDLLNAEPRPVPAPLRPLALEDELAAAVRRLVRT